MINRLLAVLHARNLEFIRDRSSMGWNLLLPILLVLGMAVIFSGGDRPMFKVGVLQQHAEIDAEAHPFLQTRYVDFFTTANEEDAVYKLTRHQMDMLLDLESGRYWINTDSPNGYVLQRLLSEVDDQSLSQGTVSGQEIRYIDWLLPGILGMNMMFSCLFGVGYVVVRYRKNGFLKRLKATPLRAIEFIVAQVLSRLLLIMLITVFIYLGITYFIDFRMEGSHATLLLVTTLGAISMIALGLVVAARVTSEELAGGILNMITWPMMLLSGVWFSLEGTSQVIQQTAKIFPLTQLLDAARAIMLDGAALGDVMPQIVTLGAMSLVLLAAGAAMFKWRLD